MMDKYRLHLDISLSADQEHSKLVALSLIDLLRYALREYPEKDNVQVRLGNDSDRGRKNYLEINENGHAANGKSPLFEGSSVKEDNV
jgi:hypothetical protein